MAFKDIRKSRPFITPAEIIFFIVTVVLLVGLLRLNIYLARTYQGGEWLYLRWSGVRAHILDEGEPYGTTIAQRVQVSVYGREAFLNEYPYLLNDPFYIVLLYYPLSFFSDFRVAQGVWMFFAEFALFGILTLSLRLSEWNVPRWLYVILILFGLLNSFSVRSVQSGAPTIFIVLLYLIVLIALRARSDEMAGGLLFLVAYQWEVGAIIILLILTIAVADRHWGVFAGFGMTGTILLVISLLAKPDWLLQYLAAIRFDWIRGADNTVPIALTYLFPHIPVSIAGWLPFLVSGALIYEIVQGLGADSRHLAWTVFLTLAFNPILGFAVFLSNHVVMVPALMMIILLAWERWTKQRIFVTMLLLSTFMFVPYWLQYQVDHAVGRFYADICRVLPPVATVLGLYWMRWWVIRPPRLWADQIEFNGQRQS